MRIKYGDEPAKFMESEVELHEAVQVDIAAHFYSFSFFYCMGYVPLFKEMHALATQPDLYELLIDHGATATLLQLLAHENSDIVAAVINLLQVFLNYREKCIGIFS